MRLPNPRPILDSYKYIAILDSASQFPLTPRLVMSPLWAVQLVESNLVQAAVFHQLPQEAQGSEVVKEENM